MRRSGAAAAFVVLEKAIPAPRIFLTASAPAPPLTAGRTGRASGGRGCRGRGGLGSPRAEVGEKLRGGAGERPRVDFSARRAEGEGAREDWREDWREAASRCKGGFPPRRAGEEEREPRSRFMGVVEPTSMPELTPAGQNASALARRSPQREAHGRRKSRVRGQAGLRNCKAWRALAPSACSRG